MILRKQIPEPIIALLAFILGIWIWDHYLGDPTEIDVGIEDVALLKIDRDLRLSEAMADDPAWLRRFAGSREAEELVKDALSVMQTLEATQRMGSRSIEAYAVLQAQQDGVPVLKMLERFGASHFETTGDPELGRGSWWRAKILSAYEQKGRSFGGWRKAYERSLRTLRLRAIGSGGAIVALALAGAFFVPRGIRRLWNGLRERPRGYGGAWSPGLGITVFIIGTLAWIGFVTALEFGIQAAEGVPPGAVLLFDTAARLLPTLIVIGFLFKRPGHVVRVMGLDRALHLRMILGLFSLLLLADRLLRGMLGGVDDAEPGGGLSIAEAGLGGLMFMLVSACIVAPLAEEILYRGVLFRSLGNRLGVFPAAVLSSIVFSMIHFYGLYGFISVAIFGFSCALLYAGTGSLVSVIALHGLYNLSIKLPEWLFYHAKLDW